MTSEQARVEPRPLDHRRPFTRAQAVAAGLNPSVLRSRRFRRVLSGVYVGAEVPLTPALRVEAALLIHPPTAFASHHSAARLLGVPVPAHAEEHISVFAENDRRRRQAVRCHVAPQTARIGLFRGLRVSMPSRVFLELAEFLSLVDLVIAGDHLVRNGLTSPKELLAECGTSTERRSGSALEAARLVRSGVDSPMETRLRLLIVLAGLPVPEVNHEVRDAFGNVVRRLDLCYPRWRLLVEYDGRQHAEDAAQYEHDIYRREELDRWGWRLVIVTSKGLFVKPEETLRRVQGALIERGATGVPRRLSDAWIPHFPVQRPGGPSRPRGRS